MKEEVSEWTDHTDAKKRDILSLVGSLQQATKVVRCGRAFVSRMYATAAKLKKMHFHTRLNMEFQSDLCWRDTFLSEWNSLTLLHWDDENWISDHLMQTDASGAWGCGSFWKGEWAWPTQWAHLHIIIKELAPIVLSCAVWGSQWSGKQVFFECDNSSVAAAVNRHYTREPEAMRLLRCLWLFVAYFDIDVRYKHIAGVNICTADHLSRNNLRAFFSLHPPGLHHCTSLPPPDARDRRTRLDISSIQEAVQHYYENGLASSTHRCYNAGQQRYLQFCAQSNITPVPTSEYTLMLFSAYLAKSGLAYTSIKVYFSAIGNWHLSCNQHTSYQEALTPRLEQVHRDIKRSKPPYARQEYAFLSQSKL